MDYQYFNQNPQPYQFLGLPPTPAHTGSANSDEFSNSPVGDVPLRLASATSTRQSHYSAHRYSSPSSPFLPVYPSQHHHSHQFLTQKQDAFDQFQQNFDCTQFNNSTIDGLSRQVKPPTPQPQPITSVGSNVNSKPSYEMSTEMNDEGARRGSNSDDDDNMTPAQSRRKAQNRAAYMLQPFPTVLR